MPAATLGLARRCWLYCRPRHHRTPLTMLGPVLFLDAITRHTGRAVRWLALLMLAGTLTVVVLRYAFGLPAIMVQESVLYAHAALFMLGAAYTWQQGGHVRVDVFSRNWPQFRRLWAERLCILLLLIPFALFLLWSGWSYVGNSWAIAEGSADAGGLPFVYLLKTLLLLLPLLLLLQALAELGKTWLPQAQDRNDQHADEETHYG